MSRDKNKMENILSCLLARLSCPPQFIGTLIVLALTYILYDSDQVQRTLYSSLFASTTQLPTSNSSGPLLW